MKLKTLVKLRNEIIGYMDFDYAKNVNTRISLTGFVFTSFGRRVNWKSNMQSIVALLTTESKYIVMTEVVKEAIWLKSLSHELGFHSEVIAIFYDNQSPIHLAKNHIYHKRSKYFDV